VTPAPGGAYTEQDSSEERALCSIDLHGGRYAICPKTFSTSPGTLIYDVSSGAYAGRVPAFEAEHCSEKRIIRQDVAGDPVSYKMTMNAASTSATFAPAALLYYHFSRYFAADVHVPVSVYRSMDASNHFERVVQRGVVASRGSGSSAMNRAAWEIMAAAAKDPSSYRPANELYTDDHKQIYGILQREDGRRYGAEIIGTRRSGWGAGQNRDFQQTAPFLALRNDAPLAEAIEYGIDQAMRDADLRKAMGSRPSAVQMTFWMKELTEIVLLDFIFSQQDRVGNIDYVDYWYWVEDGRVRSRRVRDSSVPDDLAGRGAVRIRRSQLNDNDAGGKESYSNFAKSTNMLAGIRHFGADTYVRLSRLDADFATEGPLYRWLESSFGISERQIMQVVRNAREAAAMMVEACEAGRIRFDLDPDAMIKGAAPEGLRVACRAN
jgi:hypothetical protein